MGLRGPDAEGSRRAGKNVATSKRCLPWTKAGLSRVERVIAFLEFLPITKGKLEGKRMKLLPGQRKFVEAVYGAPASRRVRVAVKSEPRGNGKTGLLAGICLCHLMGPEAEARGEVYSAAVDRTQSGKMFNEIVAIIRQVPEFAGRVNVVRHTKLIEVTADDQPGAGSIYEALSADAKKGHGLAPSLWVYDEFAQVESRELLDNLQTAMGKRKQALGIIISTQAANDDHPLSQIIDDGLTQADPSIFVDLTAAPVDADPFDLATIRSVNPALNIFLDEGDILAEADRARRVPAFEAAFRNLRLNQRVDAREDDRLVTTRVWKLGMQPIDRKALAGRKCFAALDLSGKHDLTSLTLVFPDDDPEPHFDILPFFWTPHEQIAARTQLEAERFREFIRRGDMVSIPGPVIRYSWVATELITLAREFDVQAVGHDMHRIDDFRAELADVDPDFPVPLEPFGQGFISMGKAVEWFVELALSGRLRHGGHPVLSMCVTNAILVPDAAGNRKIEKSKSNRRAPVRVDGAITLAMALYLAKSFEGEPVLDVMAMIG